MNKKNPPASFDFEDLQSPKTAIQMGIEELNNSSNSKHNRVYKGAASGCKPGYTRHTYVLPQTVINKIKAIAHNFGIPEVAVAEKLLVFGIETIIAKHGEAILKLKDKNDLI